MPGLARRLLVWTVALLALSAPPAQAQTTDESTPSFSVATSHIFTTKESPALALTYRRIDHLDFRVYRVNDAFAFFQKLRDPHQLGSEEPVVPQERTWLERIAAWKAERRSDLRTFVRQQISFEYRTARRQQRDKQDVVLRQALNVNTFAQVPVLNRSQLVTSWREILPPVRDSEFRRVPLDLTRPGIYVVEAVNPPLRAYTVVVISDVGLVTKTAPGELLVFAANRFSGDPLPNCQVRVLVDQTTVASGSTASDGTFESPVKAENADHLVTVAVCADQAAATDPAAFAIRASPRTLVGYTYTDRPVYRPGHVVRYKSVLRWREKGALVPFGSSPVEVSVVDSNEKVLTRDRKTVDAFGSLTGSFAIPAAAALGYYTLRVESGDDTATGSFEVQEYRKPEFDVAVRPAARVALQGGKVSATIAARYYFGQAVAGGSVKYVVHKQPYFSPLRFEASSGETDDVGDYGGGDQTFEGTARLGDDGLAEVSVPLDLDEDGRDYTARIEARVIDVSGREVTGAASVVTTYGRFMVCARTDRFVYAPGETANIQLRAIDYDGNGQASTRVHLVLERVEYRSGESGPRVTTVAESDSVTDQDGRARWSVAVPGPPGSYRARATATSEGRAVSDTSYLWVPGRSDEEREDERILELVADKKTYTPGDTATLLVQGANVDASVLVTKESQNVSFHQVVRASGNGAITLPITESDIGDTYVSIAFLKDDRLYRAERRLAVPASRRQLAVTATADKLVIRPGEPGVFTLHVADANGVAVKAQLSVGLVDEALYGVRPDSTPDALRFFYRREFNMVETSFSRDYPFVGYSGTDQLLLARRHRPMMLADFKAERPDRPRVRKDFPDTVFWAGDVTTDADGNAQVKVEYPDSLTTWRLTVRAVTASTDVGGAVTRTATTKDLILRVMTPRFLTEGDQVTIPTVVHNYLPAAKDVSVSLIAEGLTPTPGSQPQGARSVSVPTNGQQRVDWPFTADTVRSVTVTGKATSDVAGDAMQVGWAVLPAGLQRNTGRSGSIVEPGERSIDLTIPPTANASGRSMRVSLAPSLAGTMLGALDYLTSYPWGCTEQTLSSFVPNLVVLRTLSEMQIAPTERLQSLDRQVDDGLKRVYDYQHPDGGWGWWKTDENHPFMTAYAVDGLMLARDNGVKVDDWRISQGADALGKLYAKYPRAIPDLKAYVAYVLARTRNGSTNSSNSFNLAAALDDLWSARSRMTASGQAYLLMTLDEQKDSRGNELARELLGAAKTEGETTWWPVDSDPLLEDIADTSVEASALALKALSAREPNNAVLERVARWLVLNRSAGAYWVSTKQTAIALQGLLAYMRARGEKPAPLGVDVFLNGTRIGTRAFDAAALTAPNPVLVESPAADGVNTIRLVKQGAGALYFDAAVRYYDKPAAAERTGSRRLALTRQYSTLSPVTRNGRIVYREGAFSGTAKPGDLILVRLTAAGSTGWRYLMLEDPIPAGAEQVEKEEAYELEKRGTWSFGSDREFRDDRTVFFLSDFTRGRYEFSYLLRVTTPGTFSAMPARMSPMYVPDVSASSDVIVLTVPSEGTR